MEEVLKQKQSNSNSRSCKVVITVDALYRSPLSHAIGPRLHNDKKIDYAPHDLRSFLQGIQAYLASTSL